MWECLEELWIFLELPGEELSVGELEWVGEHTSGGGTPDEHADSVPPTYAECILEHLLSS